MTDNDQGCDFPIKKTAAGKRIDMDMKVSISILYMRYKSLVQQDRIGEHVILSDRHRHSSRVCKGEYMRKNRLPEGDDGKTIANMNIEGMPWYHKNSPDSVQAQQEGLSYEERVRIAEETHQPYQMTKEEERIYVWGALKAALLVVLIFAGAFFLFILFCEKVWFKY